MFNDLRKRGPKTPHNGGKPLAARVKQTCHDGLRTLYAVLENGVLNERASSSRALLRFCSRPFSVFSAASALEIPHSAASIGGDGKPRKIDRMFVNNFSVVALARIHVRHVN